MKPSSASEDLWLHISNRITEQESLDLFCPTCFHISELRKKYQEGKLTLEGMEKITDILKAVVKVPATSPPGEEHLEIFAGVQRDTIIRR
jgi:hypothetical protein